MQLWIASRWGYRLRRESVPTIWQSFCSRWKRGCGSSLCPEARHVCLARGTVPCDILFVGEAPSIAADVVGEPFTGEIRAVMDDIIEEAGAECFTHAFTNLVGCVPRNPEDSAKVTPPSREAILACPPRLQEFIALSRPRLIVAVGGLARCVLNEMHSKANGSTVPVAKMIHPAAILRKRPHGAYEFRQAVDALTKAVAGHLKTGIADKRCRTIRC
ncbi:MAG: hypothetical protein HY000_12615 [Planctomycetes bacterium]|nr:hypothetical protein [Planctomycetota bacterium]